VDVFHTRHALEPRPVLEPQNVVFPEVLSEGIVHKLLNDSARLRSKVAIRRLCRNWGLSPGDEMQDSRGVAVWPVIYDNFGILYSR
jgi:hypothetical protein